MIGRWAWLGLLASAAAIGQVRPTANGSDPMQQTVPYADGQTVVLETAVGYQLTVQLGSDEKILRSVTGDRSRWQVLAPADTNQFYIQPMPGALTTNMSLTTDQHQYSFLLVPAEKMTSSNALTVTFHYPDKVRVEAVAPPPAAAPADPAGAYRLSGDAQLRPSLIWDDGRKTYLDWPAGLEMPAVFAVGPDGKEQLVNGFMRDDRYVIDAVYSRLLFRLDSDTARATRQAVAKP